MSAIEDKAERMMDRLDKEYMSGRINQETYEKKVAEIEEWVRSAEQEENFLFYGKEIMTFLNPSTMNS